LCPLQAALMLLMMPMNERIGLGFSAGQALADFAGLAGLNNRLVYTDYQ
jgi:hypothetical protein